jgi:hypothetical protein
MSKAEQLAEVLDDCSPWIQTREGWEAAALLRRQDEAINVLHDALKDVAQTLAWMQHGKCRGFSDGLLTTDEALDKARSAIKFLREVQG